MNAKIVALTAVTAGPLSQLQQTNTTKLAVR